MLESELQGKRILVTGAAGFIGSRLVQALLEQGANIIACINPGEESRLSRICTSGSLRVISCSLANAKALAYWKETFRDVELVAHLWLHVPPAADFYVNAAKDVTTNILGTFNLLSILGPSLQGISFASSVQVYGRHHVPVKEDFCPNPLSSYAVTKLALEGYLRAYSQERDVPVTILRYATVYGPGEKSHRAIPNFLHSLAQGKAPTIFGNGSEVRDYVNVDDVVAATIQSLKKNQSGVLNIGSGEGRTTLEVAGKLMQLSGINLEPRFITRSESNINIVCDIALAREMLGYEPQTSLSEGLVREIEWFEREVLGRPLNQLTKRGF